MIRQFFNTIFGVIIIAFAIYGGIYAYLHLKTIENIQNTDVFEAIPIHPEMMLIYHSPKQLAEVWNTYLEFSDLLPEEKSLPIVEAIGKAQICSEQCIDKEPLIVSYYPEGALLFIRMKKHDFEYMENKFLSANLSAFAPKEESYRDAKVFFKATCDENFFCYTLYNNIFIGSFKKHLIYKAIDSYLDKKNMRSDSLVVTPFMTQLEKLDRNALAGLYINYQKKFEIFKTFIPDTSNHWITGDVRINGRALEISGFLPINDLGKINSSDSELSDMQDFDFNPGIIPLSTAYFSYSITESKIKNYTENIKALLKDTLISACFQNDMGFFSFTGSDSLHLRREAIFFKSICPEKFFKDKGYISVSHENYHIIFKNKEAEEDYNKQMENKQTFEQNQTFQALFRQHYDKDAGEITWMKDRYSFLMFSSLSQKDKFYRLFITPQP